MEKFAFPNQFIERHKNRNSCVCCVCVSAHFHLFFAAEQFIPPQHSLSPVLLRYLILAPIHCTLTPVCRHHVCTKFSVWRDFPKYIQPAAVCMYMHHAYEILCVVVVWSWYSDFKRFTQQQHKQNYAPYKSIAPLFAISCFIIKIQLTFYSSCSCVCVRECVWYVEYVHTFHQTTSHSPLASFTSAHPYTILYSYACSRIRCALCALHVLLRTPFYSKNL